MVSPASVRLVGFGLLLTFASSFGQTFFISLFGAGIRAEYGLSHGQFGAVYSAATLTSGLLIIWAGATVDRYSLRALTLVVCAGLIAAAFGMSAANTIPLLWLSLLGLRLCGQGLLSHISVTAMARYFPSGQRGTALSIAALGFPLGEALLPHLVIVTSGVLSWRTIWLTTGGLIAAVIVPLALVSLRGHHTRHQQTITRDAGNANESTTRQWTRGEVLRDLRFYAVLPAVLAPAFINTGIFFHQAHIAALKGWRASEFAAAFTVYAIAAVVSALAFGRIVDRYTATRLMPVFLVPLTAALAALALGEHVATISIYMGLAGLTQGSASVIVQSMWAERYGVVHLGAIRALATALMVVSTALSPIGFGVLFDVGISVETIALGLAGVTLIANLLLAAPSQRTA